LADLYIRTEDFPHAVDAALAARNGTLQRTGKPPESPDTDLKDLLVIGSDHPNSRYVWATSAAGFLQGYAWAKLGHGELAKQILASLRNSRSGLVTHILTERGVSLNRSPDRLA
jgi:hypothetical protein